MFDWCYDEEKIRRRTKIKEEKYESIYEKSEKAACHRGFRADFWDVCFVGGRSLLQNAKAETLADIVAPESGFNALAHYEFQDETNLGKDTLGNYDLIAKNLSVNPVKGGIALKNNGLLYAPAIGEVTGDEYTDFFRSHERQLFGERPRLSPGK